MSAAEVLDRPPYTSLDRPGADLYPIGQSNNASPTEVLVSIGTLTTGAFVMGFGITTTLLNHAATQAGKAVGLTATLIDEGWRRLGY